MTRNSVSLFRTATWSLGVLMFTTSIAAAQTPPSVEIPSFASQLQGRNVWVTADGARVRGLVTSVSPAGIVLLEDGRPITIAYDKVVRVEKSTHRVRNGALLGLASGAGVVLVSLAATCSGCEPAYWLIFPSVWGGIGAAAGAGLGALVNYNMKDTDLLYDARRSTRTMSFAPIVSQTRKGVAFSMTWR